MIRAWAHLHTVASRDAVLTHEEVRRIAVARGIGAVLVTEHREALDDRGIAVATERCRALSDHRLVLVPGLEIASEERWHVLAFGLTRAVPGGPAADLADRIRDAGAVPVLAHPTRYRPGWEGSLARIGAVEVWNRHYDGRIAPPAEIARAGRRAEGVRLLFGLDAHGPEALAGSLPEMLVQARLPTEASILEALREGRYETAFAGRPRDPEAAAGGVRAALGSAYRSLRRAAKRLSAALPVSAETRRRIGRRF